MKPLAMKAVLAGLVVAAPLGAPAADQSRTLRLPDGLEMSYLAFGKGEPALVFVHCANCRKETWRETLDGFAATHRVVAMDLPGHGRSGVRRERVSIGAFGEDVAALADHLKLRTLILVGNSLGGPVALEAARRLGPRRVLAVVAVDTLQNVEQRWPEESLRRVLDSYRRDFRGACRDLMLGLLPKDAPPEVRERTEAETCHNDAQAAIALLETVGAYDQAAALRAAGVPVWAINSTILSPTDVEANRRYAPSFQLILMEGVGHYPQFERPAEFQAHLRRVIQSVVSARPSR